MALAFYLEDGVPESMVTEENPIMSAHDGFNGSWNVVKLYVRNDSEEHYYEGVRVKVILSDVTPSPMVSTDGVMYQIYPGDIEPTIGEWQNTPFDNELVFGNLGDSDAADTTTYIPLFLRVYVPGSTLSNTSSDCSLEIAALEKAVVS